MLMKGLPNMPKFRRPMGDLPYDQWEPVIGLEIHVQLNTQTKIFSTAPNRFGDDPNMNISNACTGQPGALPVLNKEVVKKAVQLGLAIDANISKVTTFDRKSYFYPDSPRNFQITQFKSYEGCGDKNRIFDQR